MTILVCTNWRQPFGDYELNITARYIDPIAVELHTALIVRTVKTWLYVAKHISANRRELPDEMKEQSAESSIERDFGKDPNKAYNFEAYAETRVTVFDWNHALELTIHSSTLPQQALDLWWAMYDAKAELAPLYQNASKQPLPAPNQGATQSNGQTIPKALDGAGAAQSAAFSRAKPDPLSHDVIRATRAPNPNAPQYADGQMVEFTINRVVLGVHPTSGSVIYSLWSPLGRKYAIKTVYRTSAHSDEDSYDYAAIAPLLESLKLAIPGNVQAEGKWRLIMRVSHVEQKDKTVKEYLNVQSMEVMS